MASGASILASVKARVAESQRKAEVVYSAAWALCFLWKVGVLGAAFEEVAKGAIQVAKCLLCEHAGDLIEPGRFWLAFEHCQCGGGISVTHALLAFKVRVGAPAQRPIVDKARTTKGPCKQGGLLGCRVEPIAIGALLFHTHSVSCNV